jgi:hypothetical protein
MNDITIVSAFFNFKKNKYNSNDIYKFWGSNLFPNLNKNLVVFTDEDCYDFICSLRIDNLKEKTRIIKIKIEDFYMYKYIDYLKKDLERDHEKSYHNIELYMIWNEKMSFIKKAIELNFFNSSYYAWCDFGYVRNPNYNDLYMQNFPNVENLIENKIYMLNIDYNFTINDFLDPFNKNYRYISNIIGAGFIIGKKELLINMIDIYYNKIMTHYIDNDMFIGKDQTLFVSLYLSNPNLVKLIKGDNDHFCYPLCEFKWFYFLKFLK